MSFERQKHSSGAWYKLNIIFFLTLLGIVVHQESVCATFGSGLGSACIVDVGDQKTSVCCVEDGVSHRNTRYLFTCRINTSMYLITYQRLDFKKKYFYICRVGDFVFIVSCSTGSLCYNMSLEEMTRLKEENSRTDTVLYKLFAVWKSWSQYI